MKHRFAQVFLLLSVLLSAACGARPPDAEVWAEVNGQPVHRSKVEKLFERQVSLLPEPLTPWEEQARKLTILAELIQEEILWQKAAQAGIQTSEAEVEARLSELRGQLTPPEFQEQLANQQMSLAELKEELRREIAIRKLLDRLLVAAQDVTEEEIVAYYEMYRSHFRTIETEYHVAHILVTPRREPDVPNLRNDDATTEDQARRKAESLAQRIRAGEDFFTLARNFSEDPDTSLSGGDLGFFPESALQEADPALRNLLQRLEVSQVAGPVRTRDGYQIVKLLQRHTPGQRNLSDPGVRDTIRQRLQHQKRQLLETAYVSRARNQARVRNFLARQILEAHRVSP